MNGTEVVGRITIGVIGIWAAIEGILLSAVTPLARFFPDSLTRALGIINATGIVMMVVSAVFFSIWSYRAMARAHRRDPTLTISPAWSVGWYFVPIAWFYKPYEAMREIWTGNAFDSHFAAYAPLIGWWWGAWVVRGILDPLPYLLPAMPRPAMLAIFWCASLADIAAAVLVAIIINRIGRMQARGFDSSIFD